LVLMDEPTAGLSHTEAERFLKLVQSLVRDGVAVLMTDDAEGSALVPGARVLTMQRGMLRGASPSPPAEVIPLEQRRAEPGARRSASCSSNRSSSRACRCTAARACGLRRAACAAPRRGSTGYVRSERSAWATDSTIGPTSCRSGSGSAQPSRER